jgi:uncharacterized membrane protein YdjX (TVP38/TMEM64 family)
MKKIVIPFLITVILIIAVFLVFPELEVYFTGLISLKKNHIIFFSVISFMVLLSDIFLPVPSSIVMYTNGYVLGIVGGAVLSWVSVMAGAIIAYYTGRYISSGLKSEQNGKAAAILNKYGGMAIIITRGIPVLSESVCFVCGYNKMSFRHYIFLNAAGYTPVCFIYSVCGNAGYEKNIFLISFGCSLVVSALFWFAGKKYLRAKLLPE